MREIHSEINVVIDQVKVQMKENNAQMPPTGKDVVVQFQTLIHDAALIRQLLFSAQQALFEGSNGASHPQLPYIRGGSPKSTKSNRSNPSSKKRLEMKQDEQTPEEPPSNQTGTTPGMMGSIFGGLFGRR